ncbi:MAG TPA: NTF2-like N-terminal transpeptidase domain-containing protein [Blastocatellia bacterium]|nr:NTF2-like N-terminal transpeptidase domain-containing protein [Blastocatellia bacterium]
MFKLKFICCALAIASTFGLAQAQNKTGDARSAVQSFFSLLKTQKYTELHDFLPSQLQKQTTREQLAESLKRLDQFLTIQRMEIGRVQQRGDYAVVDTTIYGNLKRTMNMNGEEVKEGRVSVQQYLLKEEGRWRITTADNRTRDFFLKRNPEFKQQFQLTQPQFALKQSGKWTPLGK